MDLAEEAGQLREAMATRAPIEQAKGIIMALHGCAGDQAFAEIAEVSKRYNVKVARLAQLLVDGVGGGGSANGSLTDAERQAVATWARHLDGSR